MSCLLEGGSDNGDLLRRLTAVADSSTVSADRLLVVCAEEERASLIRTLASTAFAAVPVAGLSASSPATMLSEFIGRLAGALVGFVPVGADFLKPQCRVPPPGALSLAPWIDAVELPSCTATPHRTCASKWIASTALLRRLSPEMGLPAMWNVHRMLVLALGTGAEVCWSSIPATDPAGDPVPTLKGPPMLSRRSTVLTVIPHYRCEEWLGDCLRSICRQSRAPDGIVVIDDGSKIPPADIVSQFPEVTLLATPRNVGPYRLVREVIESTRYDGYMFQDADDWSTRERLELLLAEAERTGAELVGTQELRVLCDDEELLPVCFPSDVNAALAERPIHPLVNGTSIVSRDLVMRLGGHATGLRFSGDTEFLYRAQFAARIVNVPHFCYYRRRRPGALTTAPRTGLDSPERLELLERLREKARQNMAAMAQGTAPDLAPCEVTGPVEFAHICGPEVVPFPS